MNMSKVKIVAFFMAFALFIINYGKAQDDNYIGENNMPDKSEQSSEYPSTAFGISAGINNPSGVVGFEVQAFPGKKTSLMVGAGLSSWGYKLSAGIGAYKSPKGFYYRISANYATGGVLYDTEVETTQDTTVNMDLYLSDVWAATVNLGYSWKVGRMNVFYMGVGYTFMLSNDPYSLVKEKDPDYDISPEYRKVIIMFAPGGLSLQMGFLIGF